VPVLKENDSTDHAIHGSVFRSYVTSADGSRLCAWQLVVPPSVVGVAHRPDQDEVVLLLEGTMAATVNGEQNTLVPGDVLLVHAGDELKVDTGGDGARAWVTTTAGLTATMADGSTLAPPWAQ
jgi:quercetin dioxygenase-like cupin family protein